MSPTTWGPAIWSFFHTIAAKIKADKYSEMAPQLFNFIQRICANLPCPECSQHATRFLGKIVFKRLSSKADLIKLLFIFHNTVNGRKSKPIFAIENIERYAQNNIILSYNQFISAFNTKGNMKLLADSFQRKLIVQDLRKWFLQNLQNFE